MAELLNSKTDYVEEKPLPGNQVERIYHGKAVFSKECQTALNHESDDAKQQLATGGTAKKALGKNGKAVVGDPEYMDYMASAGALAVEFKAWGGFGAGGEIRCSVCGREHVKLRSIEAGPLFCLKGNCEDVVREAQRGNLANH